MNEIGKILESSEKIVWEGKPKFAPFMASGVIAAIVIGVFAGFVVSTFTASVMTGVLAGAGLFLLALFWSYVSYGVTHYAITTKRAVFQSGVIGRDFKSDDFDRIQNVSVDVGILGTAFKSGTVKLYTGEIVTTSSKDGSSSQSVTDDFMQIDDPYGVLKLLQSNLSTRKERLYGGKT